ncbi:DUF6227 family protein [Streptomyces corynorhini]|uniref:Uncharacterized protein n=1 Tax=Streptomyces corynorhini TaxID=2282652 RepID=A0A370B529_9ACTN|nr:DUF6227 family protein [Streptomyces corynorhini]RDG36920.1 hypothetical protein DVH02_17460 [Streptomyces corynorhini]
MNDPYETTETHLERLLGRALNSFDLPDAVVDRLDRALAHASSLCSAHHSAGLHRETYRHTYLLTDGSALSLWELVHNTGRDGARMHELYADESGAQLAAARLCRPGSPEAPKLSAFDAESGESRVCSVDPADPQAVSPAGEPPMDDIAAGLLSQLESERTAEIDAHLALLRALRALPAPAPAPRHRMYSPDNSPDHARRVLRRAENDDRPGEETGLLLKTAFAHHITQVFGRQCQVEGKDAGFMLYEHAFLLIDGSETSLWEVEHTATQDGRHMCEVYETESAAREAMELRAQVR